MQKIIKIKCFYYYIRDIYIQYIYYFQVDIFRMLVRAKKNTRICAFC